MLWHRLLGAFAGEASRPPNPASLRLFLATLRMLGTWKLEELKSGLIQIGVTAQAVTLA